jgi:hypothetical protein
MGLYQPDLRAKWARRGGIGYVGRNSGGFRSSLCRFDLSISYLRGTYRPRSGVNGLSK